MCLCIWQIESEIENVHSSRTPAAAFKYQLTGQIYQLHMKLISQRSQNCLKWHMNSRTDGSDDFSDYTTWGRGGGTCYGRQASEHLQKTRIKSADILGSHSQSGVWWTNTQNLPGTCVVWQDKYFKSNYLLNHRGGEKMVPVIVILHCIKYGYLSKRFIRW